MFIILPDPASLDDPSHSINLLLLISEAELALTLRNRGEEAYKASDYGHSITIIRQIKKDGGGAYKLRGTLGGCGF